MEYSAGCAENVRLGDTDGLVESAVADVYTIAVLPRIEVDDGIAVAGKKVFGLGQAKITPPIKVVIAVNNPAKAPSLLTNTSSADFEAASGIVSLDGVFGGWGFLFEGWRPLCCSFPLLPFDINALSFVTRNC